MSPSLRALKGSKRLEYVPRLLLECRAYLRAVWNERKRHREHLRSHSDPQLLHVAEGRNEGLGRAQLFRGSLWSENVHRSQRPPPLQPGLHPRGVATVLNE